MVATLKFVRDFEPEYGKAVQVALGVQRITARNPSPFTFTGTNTYTVGHASVAVVDPGPDDPDHLQALLAALHGRPVSHILVTHTHRDHSPLARRLQDATGAPIVAEGPHRPARLLAHGESNLLAESCDTDLVPDIQVEDGHVLVGEDWRLHVVLTPGHTANHAAFRHEESSALLCGDHVMAWATTIVAPPDGSMADYMASLDKLIARQDPLLLPGHGGPISDPAPFLRALRAHRQMRQTAILQRLRSGDRLISEIVERLYAETDKRLHGAAALSVLAHLEKLVGEGAVRCEGQPSLAARFHPLPE